LQYGTLLKLSKIPILAVAFFRTSIQPAYNPNSKVLPTPRGHKETANVTTEAQLKYHGTTETHRNTTPRPPRRHGGFPLCQVLGNQMLYLGIPSISIDAFCNMFEDIQV